MKPILHALRVIAFSLLLPGALAQAATVSGTVTNKTNGKPAVGDSVVLVDVQAGMSEVAKATTDAQGHYTLNEPGSGPYLIRVTHQGVGYFIAAPQGGGPGDIPVYDVAAKVQGVRIEADIIQVEADNGQLKVDERYFVHNTSTPPVTQWSPHAFDIVLPPDAVITVTGAQRPSGLPISAKLDPHGPKGHYAFNFPIEPDQGDKDTLFQVVYTLPYSAGKFTFHAETTLPADNLAVLMPKSMTFSAGAGASFQSVQADPGVLTFLAKNTVPGKALAFTVAGTGSIPREQQADNGSQAASAAANQPGGGIGAPIDTPDPLTKYKWWILMGLALLLATAAGFLLRKPALAAAPGAASGSVSLPDFSATATPAAAAKPSRQATGNTALLNALKEELFALESEKLSGTLDAVEYAEAKAALETVLKRALKRSS